MRFERVALDLAEPRARQRLATDDDIGQSLIRGELLRPFLNGLLRALASCLSWRLWAAWRRTGWDCGDRIFVAVALLRL